MNPRTLKTIKDYAEALFIALLLALFIRTFVVQAFKIPSGSMLQTLQIGDHLLVNKFAYGVRLPFVNTQLIPVGEPEFQDIVVFKFPGERDISPDIEFRGFGRQMSFGESGKDFIKRIIGLPGDVIEIREKQVYRNGEALQEPYVQHVDPRFAPGRDEMPAFTVPEDHYFVMGDNRDESYDSRFWGLVPRELILGEAMILYWSWGPRGITDVRWDRIGSRVR